MSSAESANQKKHSIDKQWLFIVAIFCLFAIGGLLVGAFFFGWNEKEFFNRVQSVGLFVGSFLSGGVLIFLALERTADQKNIMIAQATDRVTLLNEIARKTGENISFFVASENESTDLQLGIQNLISFLEQRHINDGQPTLKTQEAILPLARLKRYTIITDELNNNFNELNAPGLSKALMQQVYPSELHAHLTAVIEIYDQNSEIKEKLELALEASSESLNSIGWFDLMNAGYKVLSNKVGDNKFQYTAYPYEAAKPRLILKSDAASSIVDGCAQLAKKLVE